MIGQFFTPEPVARLMYRLAKARPGQRVMDPACGDGAFLRVAPAGCELHGCELDKRLHPALRRLLSHGRFVAGDAFARLRSLHGVFDLVIGNPPFSAQTHPERRPAILRQFDLGAGRRSQCLEVLFLELFLKLAKPGGRIAIILPDGPFANRPFHYVRHWLLEHACVETIVSLPRGVFPRTAAKTHILIARKFLPEEPPSRRPARLFIGGRGRLAKRKNGDNGIISSSLSPWASAVLDADADWRPEAYMGGSRQNDGICVGDCFTLRTGFARYGHQRELFDAAAPGRILLIRAKNFAPDGGLRLDRHCAYVCRHSPMFRVKALVRPGELLFVRVGVGCYGRAAIVPPNLAAQADDWIHVLTPKTAVDAQAVAGWMNSAEGRAALQRLAKGVGTLSISKSSLAAMALPASILDSSHAIVSGAQTKRASKTLASSARARQYVGDGQTN
jgi:type I restriction enzyme M protein